MQHDDKNNGTEEGVQRRSPADLFERLLGRDNPVIEQLDKNARLLAQSALSKLDVVPNIYIKKTLQNLISAAIFIHD